MPLLSPQPNLNLSAPRLSVRFWAVVILTGLGAVTPVGQTAAATWEALTAGRSGIARITRFDATECTAQIAGEVKDFDPVAVRCAPVYPRGPAGPAVTASLSAKEVKKLGRFSHLGLAAGLEAYADSGLDGVRATLSPERIGINLGVGLGGLPEIVATHETWKQGGFRKISPFFILQSAPNILAGQLAILLDCRGPNLAVASACATSGHALGESFRMVQRGDADVMLAGGAEAVITQVAVGAFAQMRALSTRNDAPTAAKSGRIRLRTRSCSRFALRPRSLVTGASRAPWSSSSRSWNSPGGAAPGSTPRSSATPRPPMPTISPPWRPKPRVPAAPCSSR